LGKLSVDGRIILNHISLVTQKKSGRYTQKINEAVQLCIRGVPNSNILRLTENYVWVFMGFSLCPGECQYRTVILTIVNTDVNLGG
jgi:hypothetical protein